MSIDRRHHPHNLDGRGAARLSRKVQMSAPNNLDMSVSPVARRSMGDAFRLLPTLQFGAARRSGSGRSTKRDHPNERKTV